jgi:bis(5'-nucleosyl)-tetraphosphatase (symmetrical)
MALYAVGDVQGCFDGLRSLLDKLRFDPVCDRLWLTGDLVNRGPRSADVLRLVMSLPDTVSVLGNHDLHLLAAAAGKAPLKQQDTLDNILDAPDRDVLLDWLRQRPLLHHDGRLDYTLIHAGLAPSWDLKLAMSLAREAETVIRASATNDLFDYMYGNEPDCWGDGLAGRARIRVIINTFTRLRYCDTAGHMALDVKGAPGSQPPGYLPWFQIPNTRHQRLRLVFGHWSTLGLWKGDNVLGLDTGCLWGGELTAVRLDTEEPRFTSVPCAQSQRPY